jgi:hypothetical protein
MNSFLSWIQFYVDLVQVIQSQSTRNLICRAIAAFFHHSEMTVISDDIADLDFRNYHIVRTIRAMRIVDDEILRVESKIIIES